MATVIVFMQNRLDFKFSFVMPPVESMRAVQPGQNFDR
jgi:hypothetical protein